MLLSVPHKRVGWLIAAAMLFVTTNLLACESAQSAVKQIETVRLNLPSGVEPANHAPKQYRSPRKYDPDYYKHPSRWNRKLRARYA